MKWLLGLLAAIAGVFAFKAKNEENKRLKTENKIGKSTVKAAQGQAVAKKTAKKKASAKQKRINGMSREDKINHLSNPNKRL